MKRLIVTADDFGLAESVNAGIAIARREGIVTCVSLTPSGKAFAHALKIIPELKLEDIGVHVALTGTRPVCDPAEVPTLCNRDGSFYPHFVELFARFAAGFVRTEHIYREVKAQLDRARSSGLMITSLSTHEHIHMFLPIMRIVADLANGYGIGAIRVLGTEPRVGAPSVRGVGRNVVARLLAPGAKGMLERAGIRYADHYRGFLASGNLDERGVLEILSGLPEGTTELGTHPAMLSPEILDEFPFHKHGEFEVFALQSRRVKKTIEDLRIKLISFRQFLSE